MTDDSIVFQIQPNSAIAYKFYMGKLAQGPQVNVALVVGVESRYVSRQHSRIGSMHHIGDENHAHPRNGIHRPLLEGDRMAVATADKDESLG